MSKFERTLSELQKIIEQLQNEDLELEKAVQLYEQGVKLSKVAKDMLEKAEFKVKKLKEEMEGEEPENE